MKPRVLKRGGRGVEVSIISARTPGPDTVFWSERVEKDGEVVRHGGNSFVVVASDTGDWRTRDGERVALLSVNGIGEIRWSVSAQQYDHRNAEGSIEHFELEPWVGEQPDQHLLDKLEQP